MSISDPDAVLAGTFLARAVYGGDSISESFQGSLIGDGDKPNYDDDYRGYIAAQSDPATHTWRLLAAPELGDVGPGNFTAEGLYRSPEDVPLLFDDNVAEAMVVERTTVATGERTLFLTFRGSDGGDAFFEGQTFTATGLAYYYGGLIPIIEATRKYVDEQGIDKVVVSGHSLGGTIVDLFALTDSGSFADVDLTLVSLASAGLESDIGEVLLALPILHPTIFTDGVIQAGQLTVPAAVDTYIAINHTGDRVYYSIEPTTTLEVVNTGLTANIALFPNQHYDGAVAIDLPNIGNQDVVYRRGFFEDVFIRSGFGAEHNIDLYWANVQALLSDSLYDRYVGQNIIMGVNSYGNTPDYGPTPLSVTNSFFAAFTGSSDNDSGERSINGTVNADYILGLSGRDRLAGESGNDIISGGDGQDDLFGGSEDDYLHGGSGGDLLRGEDDNDTLDGGVGLDKLYGDGGDDTLIAGASDFDSLYGGPGSDRFVFGTNGYVLSDKFNYVIDYNQGDMSGMFSDAEGDLVDISALTGFAYANGTSASELARLVPLSISFNDSTFQTLEVFDSDAGVWTPIARFSNVPLGDGINIYYGERADLPDAPSPRPLPATSPPGSFQISPVDETVVEDDSTVRFTITRLDDRAEETVYVSTTFNRGSPNGGDYDGILNHAVTFAPGDDEATVDIRIRDDSSHEAVETFGLIVQSSPDQAASQYLASGSFSIIDDDAAGGAVNFTSGSNQEWITPVGGTESFDGEGGTDQVTLDLREWSSVSTSTSGATRSFIGPEGRLNFTNVEQFVVIGTPGNDNIVTGPDTDIILGGDGNDQIDGGAGVDAMNGGDGDDTFINVGVLDIVAGGEGVDTVRFGASEETQNLTINLGTGQGLLGSWTGIERLSGTLGSGDDTVVAGAVIDDLSGGGGTDFLTLDYSGGVLPGTDLALRYVTLQLHLDTNLSTGRDVVSFTTAAGGSGAYTFQVNQFERFDITGSDGNDQITTKDGDDRIVGGRGDDNIDAGGGADTVEGGEGDDRITNIGMGGAIAGGTGRDLVSLSLGAVTQNVTVDIVSGIAPGGGTMTGVERLSGTLGTGDDTVVAGAVIDDLSGGGGTDFLTLDYSGGVLPGTDLALRYVTLQLHLDTNLSTGRDVVSFTTAAGGSGAYTFQVNQFERFDITGSDGNDQITTKDGDDRIVGGRGDDNIDAGGGADTVEGGEGDDRITNIGMGGAIAGGTGRDLVSLSLGAVTQNVTVDIVSGIAPGGGTMTGVERLSGTLGTGDDTVVAGAVIDDLSGGGGTDFLTLDYSGGVLPGTDLALRYVTLQLHLDTNLSTGRDVVSFTTAAGGSGAYTFQVNQFERFDITGSDGNDQITTKDGDDRIVGGRGDDNIDAGGGADTVEGGEGDDRITNIGMGGAIAGGTGRDLVSLSLGAVTQNVTVDIVSGIAPGGGTMTGVERLSGTLGTGDDTVVAGAVIDDLSGGGGTDFLTLDYSGGVLPGTDLALRYVTLQLHLDTNLSTGRDVVSFTTAAGGSGAYTFQVNQFERFDITGSDGNDQITTKDGDDRIVGGRGDDYIDAGGGADTVEGGEGDDRITGGNGNDIFIMRPGESDDIITDFQKGSAADDGDKIDITAYAITFDQIGFQQEPGGLRLLLGTDSVFLQGLSLSTLDPYDFLGLAVDGLADLASSDLAISNAIWTYGDTIDFSWVTSNLGSSDAALNFDGIHLSIDPSVTLSDRSLGGTQGVSIVGSPSNQEWSYEIRPDQLSPGTYYVAAIADVFGDVVESDETNNASSVIQIEIQASDTGTPVQLTTTVLNSGNSNINLDGATNEFTDFGGQDTYTFLSSLSADVTIADNNPSTINLLEGIVVTSALFLADGAQFTINGNTVTLLGDPASFDFVFGGTPLDPNAGTTLSFAQTANAFGTSIPAQGGAPNAATVIGEVQADGTLGGTASFASLVGMSNDQHSSDYFSG